MCRIICRIYIQKNNPSSIYTVYAYYYAIHTTMFCIVHTKALIFTSLIKTHNQ